MDTKQTIEKLKEWQTEIARAADGSAMWGSVYFESLNADIASAITALQTTEKVRAKLHAALQSAYDFGLDDFQPGEQSVYAEMNEALEASSAIAAQQEAENV